MPPFLSSLDLLFAVGGVVPMIGLGVVVYRVARGRRRVDPLQVAPVATVAAPGESAAA